MIAQVCFKGFLGLKLVLEESVHLDQVSLDVLEFVCWYALRVKYEQVIIEDVALDEGSKIRAATARDTIC